MFAERLLERDLFDIPSAAYESGLSAVTNVGKHGCSVFNFVNNDKGRQPLNHGLDALR